MYQNRQDNDFSRHIPPPIGETFDPVAWEPGRQPGPSPNPSVTPITGSPCSTRVITVSSSASSSLETPSFPFFPFSLSKESEPNRGASIEEGSTRDDTYTSRSHTQVIVSAVHGCRVSLVCYCVAQAVAAAGCRCTLHYLSDPSGEETSVSAACIVIEWYNKRPSEARGKREKRNHLTRLIATRRGESAGWATWPMLLPPRVVNTRPVGNCRRDGTRNACFASWEAFQWIQRLASLPSLRTRDLGSLLAANIWQAW